MLTKFRGGTLRIAAYILLLIAPVVLALIYYHLEDIPRTVFSGVADFRTGMPKGIVPLNGEWEFYPGKMLTPEELRGRYVESFIDVPVSWTRQETEDGKPKLALGSGTYHVKVLMPKGTLDDLAISTGIIRTAYRIYVNGRLRGKQDEGFSGGNVLKPYVRPEVCYFEGAGVIDIVIQVSNQSYSYLGGIITPVEFGDVYAVSGQKTSHMAANIAVIAIYICVLLVFIGQFLQRNKQYELLYFSGFCFFQMLLSFCVGDRLLLRLLPDLPYEYYVKISLFVSLSSVLFLLGYVRFALYRNRYIKVFKVFIAGSLASALACFLVPLTILSDVDDFIMLFSLLEMFFIVYAMFLAIRDRVDGHQYLALGVACFIWIFVSAIFEAYGWMTSHWTNTIIVPLFLVSQLLFITERHRQNELREKTEATELAYLRAQINPHFIYNALGSIAGLIVEAPYKARDTLVSFSDYLRKMFKSDISKQLTTIEEELMLSEDYLSIEAVRFGNRLVVETDMPEELMRMRIPPLTIQPVVENAVKHGMVRDKVLVVRVTGQLAEGCAEITVTDNGPGFSPETLQRIERSSGKGVGINNSRQRLRRYGGDMQFWSSAEGATVRITLKTE